MILSIQILLNKPIPYKIIFLIFYNNTINNQKIWVNIKNNQTTNPIINKTIIQIKSLKIKTIMIKKLIKKHTIKNHSKTNIHPNIQIINLIITHQKNINNKQLLIIVTHIY